MFSRLHPDIRHNLRTLCQKNLHILKKHPRGYDLIYYLDKAVGGGDVVTLVPWAWGMGTDDFDEKEFIRSEFYTEDLALLLHLFLLPAYEDAYNYALKVLGLGLPSLEDSVKMLERTIYKAFDLESFLETEAKPQIPGERKMVTREGALKYSLEHLQEKICLITNELKKRGALDEVELYDDLVYPPISFLQKEPSEFPHKEFVLFIDTISPEWMQAPNNWHFYRSTGASVEPFRP